MTVALAWVGEWTDGREHLYVASDSRVTGGHRLDACPKILTLPRSDCVICFAGATYVTYPLMLQLANAIGAHQPSAERSLDIGRVKDHLLRVFTDLAARIRELPTPLVAKEVQFIFGGYSWAKKSFRVWTIYYNEAGKRFAAREAKSFHPRLRQATFIGDWAKPFRSRLVQHLNSEASRRPVYMEPLQVLAGLLRSANASDSIGGAPQLVRVTQHLNTRPLCVRWEDEDTLFGRPLFPYENTDYLIVDPFTGGMMRSRKFGTRIAPVRDSAAVDDADRGFE